jgi:nucleotide-binding universal stress UspA family protein
MENTRTVLVPLDFSEASILAFEAALVLHAHPGTTVVVQHVVDVSNVDFAVELGYGMASDVASKARTHAETTMRRLTDVEPPEGVEIERVVCVGRPVLEILRLAAELETDLVVLGSKVSSAAEHAIFGSTATRVLRAARCPVLVIPGPGGAPQIHQPNTDAPSGAPSTV